MPHASAHLCIDRTHRNHPHYSHSAMSHLAMTTATALVQAAILR